MEAAVEANLARSHLPRAWNILDALGDLIPCRVKFICSGIARCWDRLVSKDEGIQRDDLAVAMKDVNRELPGDEARDGGDCSKDFFLPKHDCKGRPSSGCQWRPKLSLGYS